MPVDRYSYAKRRNIAFRKLYTHNGNFMNERSRRMRNVSDAHARNEWKEDDKFGRVLLPQWWVVTDNLHFRCRFIATSLLVKKL